jgi:hypothetical protein
MPTLRGSYEKGDMVTAQQLDPLDQQLCVKGG